MGSGYYTPVYYPDFRVAEVTPRSGIPLGVETLFSIKIQNIGQSSGSTDAALKIIGPDGVSHTVAGTNTTVSVGRYGLSFAKYTFTQPGSYQIVATANPRSTVAEESEGNNSKADSITVTRLPEVAEATANAPKIEIPPLPSTTNGYKAVGWQDNGSSYNGNITITETIDYLRKTADGVMKSGYGFEMEVRVKKTTNYVKPSYVYKPQKVYAYVPEWNYEKAIELKKTGETATETIWSIPENSESVTDAKKWYVPEWWPDDSDYVMKIEVTGAYTPGDTLNASKLCTVNINSNMYTDDYSPGR